MLLGRYEVIRKIGAGGFGEVLLARSIGAEGFERIVALKRLKGDLARRQGSLQGIINEARIGGLLSHPNIVQVLEFIQIGTDYVLVMEYVDGIALQEILELDRGVLRLLSPHLALEVAIQACEGLHYAHAARSVSGRPLKLIHRDIKPSNLMITRTGTVKIMDFGVARSSANTGNSSTGSIKGTLRYLSPEQAEGSREIGHGSDLFSLGLVLAEMILGRAIYEADQEHLVLLRALQAQTGDAVREAEQVYPGLGPVLARCLDPNPEQRYPTAEELAQDLRVLQRQRPGSGTLIGLVEQALSLSRRTGREEDYSTETTFSLELRRKGLASGRSWELVAGEDDSSETAAEPADSSPDDQDSASWEWEWHFTATGIRSTVPEVAEAERAAEEADGTGEQATDWKPGASLFFGPSAREAEPRPPSADSRRPEGSSGPILMLVKSGEAGVLDHTEEIEEASAERAALTIDSSLSGSATAAAETGIGELDPRMAIKLGPTAGPGMVPRAAPSRPAGPAAVNLAQLGDPGSVAGAPHPAAPRRESRGQLPPRPAAMGAIISLPTPAEPRPAPRLLVPERPTLAGPTPVFPSMPGAPLMPSLLAPTAPEPPGTQRLQFVLGLMMGAILLGLGFLLGVLWAA